MGCSAPGWASLHEFQGKSVLYRSQFSILKSSCRQRRRQPNEIAEMEPLAAFFFGCRRRHFSGLSRLEQRPYRGTGRHSRVQLIGTEACIGFNGQRKVASLCKPSRLRYPLELIPILMRHLDLNVAIRLGTENLLPLGLRDQLGGEVSAKKTQETPT